jgi:hypothetical protein
LVAEWKMVINALNSGTKVFMVCNAYVLDVRVPAGASPDR